MEQPNIRGLMVNGDQYVERVCSVMRQFEMVRNALAEFRDNATKQDHIAQEAISSFLKGFRKIYEKAFKNQQRSEPKPEPHRSAGVSPENEVYGFHSEHEHVREHFRLIGDEAKGKFVQSVETALNGVNQNELILMVALFEMQMKEIHREILRQEPVLLNTERQIPLGKIIAEGVDGILQLEIEREVQSLDRKTVDERATYFQQRLGLDWRSAVELQAVRRMIEARNKLLHEQPNMTVTNDQLQEVRTVILGLPFHCCEQCIKKHPDAFEQWDGWLTTDWHAEDLD